MLSGSTAPIGLESTWAASTFTNNTPVSDFIEECITSGSSTTVLGYLAYITLDEKFIFISDASGILPATNVNSVSTLAIQNIVIPKNGYIYIYVANESPTNVYFDNLQIIHEKSNVVELSDYYPYGLRNGE